MKTKTPSHPQTTARLPDCQSASALWALSGFRESWRELGRPEHHRCTQRCISLLF